MLELILDFILKLVGLGWLFFVVEKVFSRKAKKVHFTINHNGVDFDSSFYEE